MRVGEAGEDAQVHYIEVVVHCCPATLPTNQHTPSLHNQQHLKHTHDVLR
jgi:hypothetical protein